MEVFHNFEVDSKDVVDLKSSLGKDYDTVLTVGLTASCSWPGVLDYLLHSCRSAVHGQQRGVVPFLLWLTRPRLPLPLLLPLGP